MVGEETTWKKEKKERKIWKKVHFSLALSGLLRSYHWKLIAASPTTACDDEDIIIWLLVYIPQAQLNFFSFIFSKKNFLYFLHVFVFFPIRYLALEYDFGARIIFFSSFVSSFIFIHLKCIAQNCCILHPEFFVRRVRKTTVFISANISEAYFKLG